MPEPTSEQLILTAQNLPFKTAEIARAAIGKKGLDKNVHDVKELEDGGWAIVPCEPKKQAEKYFKVRFHAKSQPNDTEDVQLIVNGENLTIQREKEVIIPGRFRECADNARYPQYRQVPGQQRKVAAWIRTYNYDFIGEATEEEWKEMFAEGNRIQRENIRKYGYGVQPEDVDQVA